MIAWDNLSDQQIRQLGQWLCYAEHHAEHCHMHSYPDDRAARCGWAFEIKECAATLVQLRDIWERRHGNPPCPPRPLEPSHLPEPVILA
jgi:hypothetical protein